MHGVEPAHVLDRVPADHVLALLVPGAAVEVGPHLHGSNRRVRDVGPSVCARQRAPHLAMLAGIIAEPPHHLDGRGEAAFLGLLVVDVLAHADPGHVAGALDQLVHGLVVLDVVAVPLLDGGAEEVLGRLAVRAPGEHPEEQHDANQDDHPRQIGTRIVSTAHFNSPMAPKPSTVASSGCVTSPQGGDGRESVYFC